MELLDFLDSFVEARIVASLRSREIGVCFIVKDIKFREEPSLDIIYLETASNLIWNHGSRINQCCPGGWWDRTRLNCVVLAELSIFALWSCIWGCMYWPWVVCCWITKCWRQATNVPLDCSTWPLFCGLYAAVCRCFRPKWVETEVNYFEKNVVHFGLADI